MHFFRGFFRKLRQRFLWRDQKPLLFVFCGFSLFVAIYMMLVEGLSLVDSYYFLVTTGTTVGYGDFSPQTTFGKVLVTFYMVIGIAVIGLLLGKVTDGVISLSSLRRRGKMTINSTVKLLIAGYPSEQKLQQLVGELRHDARFGDACVVVLTNRLEDKPDWMTRLGVEFVSGVASDAQTLKRAGVESAETILILANEPDRIESDDYAVAVCAVAEQINMQARTIVERVRSDELIFKIVHADTVVAVSPAAVLAQEILDPGAIELQDAIFCNSTKGTQFNHRWEGERCLWRDLAPLLLSHNAIPEGFRNPDEKHFNLLPQGDQVIEPQALIKYRSAAPLPPADFFLK